MPGRPCARHEGERLDVQRLRVLPVDPVAYPAQPREVAQALSLGGFRVTRTIVRCPAIDAEPVSWPGLADLARTCSAGFRSHSRQWWVARGQPGLGVGP